MEEGLWRISMVSQNMDKTELGVNEVKYQTQISLICG